MLAVRRLILVAVLTIAVAVAGCGSSSSSGSSKVTPAAYVKSVCSAIGPFEQKVQSRSSALNLSSIKNAAQGKTALHNFLTQVAADTQHAVSQLKAAGTPDVNNGKAVAAGIVTAFTRVQSALSSAATRAQSLPTSSPQAFKAAAAALGSSVQSSMSTIGSSLGSLKSSTLESAAAKEPTCKSLGTGG